GVAFAAASADPALREELRDYLRRQSDLAAVQIEEAKREDAIRHWGLRVRHVSDVLKLGFELAVAFIVIAIAIGLGVALWQAAHADGLVIESFNVPASMAQKGLTGQVVADKLLDRLIVMQSQADSIRAPSTFANDSTSDITVQIPDTGVSLGQVVRFLNDWLGKQTHLTGDLYETPSGMALTVRTDGNPGQTIADKAGTLDGLVDKAAEAVFAQSQPYRFAVYLIGRHRFAEAVAVLRGLAATGSADDRAWADLGLGNFSSNRGDFGPAWAYYRAGQSLDPNLPNFMESLAIVESKNGREEDAYRDTQQARVQIAGGGDKQWTPSAVPTSIRVNASNEEQLQGDYRAAKADNIFAPGTGGNEAVLVSSASIDVALHDVAAAQSDLAALDALEADPDAPLATNQNRLGVRALLAAELQDWAGTIRDAEARAVAAQANLAATRGRLDFRISGLTGIAPWQAYALARLGRFVEADALLNTMPADCDQCARMQGRVAALQHDWERADRWFALVAARSPDIPFADTDWGQMLLWKGDLDGAIAHFGKAHTIGPKFADPLEMWGEALIAKNRSDLALAKFEEANKYAPNWGRLHLKWGQALLWTGDRAGAAAQFARAAALDLSAQDRAKLPHG
ncbi:MAG TPA: hypothetical protein VJ476_11300, partial [Rhizomicrobium sp.]|nr:hypothetical protein [Rhizomicrobium sp.]